MARKDEDELAWMVAQGYVSDTHTRQVHAVGARLLRHARPAGPR